MKTILIDATYIQNEQSLKKSVALYLLRLLDALEDRGGGNFAFILFLRLELYNYFKTRYKKINIKLVVFSAKRISRISFIQSIANAFMWKRQVNAVVCDIVYVPFTWIYNSLKINKKKVVTIHDLKPIRELTTAYATKMVCFKGLILSIFKFFFLCAVRNADKIIAISAFVKKDIEQTFRVKAEIKVIYDGLWSGKCIYSKQIQCLENVSYFLYVNTIDRFKNTVTLLHAYNQLDISAYKLVIVGKETDYWLQTCVPVIGNNKNIIRFDYVTDEELHWLYENATLFITTSLCEGLGATPIEAAMHGCPVLSSRSEALPEATMEAVFYYEPASDCFKLAGAIKKILDARINNSEFNRNIQIARSKMQQRYNIDGFVKNILSYLVL